jgi:PAS domain S-box-containing protein
LDAELYRILVENSADMIVRGDAVGRRIYVSPSYQEFLGYAPDEVLGGDRLSIVHPDEAEAVAAALRTLGPLTPPVGSVSSRAILTKLDCGLGELLTRPA